MIHEQGSPEWFKARLGRLTGSCAKDWVCKDGKITDTALTYLFKRLGEIKTGEPSDDYINDDMLFGQEQEPIARYHYSKQLGVEVTQVGFIQHHLMPFMGVSVDGQVIIENTLGNIEIKTVTAKNSAVHMRRCVIDSPEACKKLCPKEYWQMMSGMLVTGAKFCDFISFNPFLGKEEGGMFVFRLPYNEKDGKILFNSAEICRDEMIRMGKILSLDVAKYGYVSTPRTEAPTKKIELKKIA